MKGVADSGRVWLFGRAHCNVTPHLVGNYKTECGRPRPQQFANRRVRPILEIIQSLWHYWPSPEGTYENSPAFHRWGLPRRKLSPGGTAETLPQSSLRDLESVNREPSVETLGYSQSCLRHEPPDPACIGQRRPHSAKRSPLLFGLALFASPFIAAANPPLSFTNDIAPIFAQRCLTCHGAAKSKGGYRLDTFDSLLKPGSSKESPITPGEPAHSKLFQLITAADEDDRMPQKNEPLSAAEISRIQRWIADGAKFDGPDSKAELIAIIPPVEQPEPPTAYLRPIPITALAFSPDGTELAASGYHEITIWSSTNGALLHRIHNVAERTLCLAYQPHGALLAAASGTPGRAGEAKLFDARTGSLFKLLATIADSMLAVAFTPDGSKLAVGGADNAVRIFDVATGKQERIIEQHADWVTSLAFSRSGALLASASRDKSARIYDPKTGEMETSYLGHGDFVFGAAFSADDKRIFSCGRDRKIHIWGAGEEKKEKTHEISGFDGDVLRLIVTSNAVFSCSLDGSARQHTVAKTPELVRTFRSDGEAVYALALDERSQKLATGSFNGKVRVWDVSNGQNLLTFTAIPGLLEAAKKE